MKWETTNATIDYVRSAALMSKLDAFIPNANYVLEWGGQNPNLIRIITPEDVTEQAMSDFMATWSSLVLSANKTTIAADDTDTATITLTTAEPSINYRVYASDSTVDFSGTLDAVGGSVSYAFKTPIADRYLIEFYQPAPNEQTSGYTEILAQ